MVRILLIAVDEERSKLSVDVDNIGLIAAFASYEYVPTALESE